MTKGGLADSPFFQLPPKEEPSPSRISPSQPQSSQVLVVAPSLPQSEEETVTGSKRVHKKTSKLVNMFTSKQVYIDKYLKAKAYRTASWRVPQEIVDKFEEMYYLAKSKYRSDTKRYELIVAALALFLWDFETNGEESDLYKLLIKKDEETV